jgi:peroxiredoxin family protein
MASPDKLSFIVHSGDYGRVHYALVMASAAAAIDKAVTLMFTMDGARTLLADGAPGAPDWSGAEAANAANGIATVAEMLAACVELGVVFMACDMGLKACGIERGDLRADIEIGHGGAAAFIRDASRHGTILFV